MLILILVICICVYNKRLIFSSDKLLYKNSGLSIRMHQELLMIILYYLMNNSFFDDFSFSPMFGHGFPDSLLF